MRPFRQAWPHWDYAAELMLIAATTGEEADIERVTAQMERALRRDNWLCGCRTVPIRSVKLRPNRRWCASCATSAADEGNTGLTGLLEQYGPDIAMPDLHHELAQCPHRGDMSNPCQVK